MNAGGKLYFIVRHVRLPSNRRAEQIMAMPAVERRWTAREVRQLIAESPLQTPRYELVNGELLVTPSPIGLHQRAVALLWKALDDYLQRSGVGDAYISPSDVELEPNTIVQPDVYVVPPHESQRILRELPARELIAAAEVLSPSSGRHDRVDKRLLYGRHLPEYWIVDLDARIVERWRRHAEQPQILVSSLEWHPEGAAEPFRLDLPKYFAAVYREPVV
jgi:Uma2 family endonuclease